MHVVDRLKSLLGSDASTLDRIMEAHQEAAGLYEEVLGALGHQKVERSTLTASTNVPVSFTSDLSSGVNISAQDDSPLTS